LKTIDGLKWQIAEFPGVGDVNIDGLVKMLDAAQIELDGLKGFGNEFDGLAEEHVRQPLREVETTREATVESRLAENHSITENGLAMMLERQEAKRAYIAHVSEENEQLREKNDQIRRELSN
jgi:hypothetical protein